MAPRRRDLSVIVVSHPLGEGLGRPLRFHGRDQVVVGRDPRSEFSVQDAHSVSRKHARISWLRGGLYVEDLGSTNGILVNGQRAELRRRLSSGDEIDLGEVRLLVLKREDSAKRLRALREIRAPNRED